MAFGMRTVMLLGGSGSGAFAPYGAGVTWDPAFIGPQLSLSGGNLTLSHTGGGAWNCVLATQGKSSTRSYWEITIVSGSGLTGFWGVGGGDTGVNTSSFLTNAGNACDGSDTLNQVSGTVSKTFAGTLMTAPSDGDIVMFALDASAKKLWIGKNGVWANSGDPATGTGNWVSSLPATFYAGAQLFGNVVLTANFGATAFVYGPP
jgi:hypothetical protein